MKEQYLIVGAIVVGGIAIVLLHPATHQALTPIVVGAGGASTQPTTATTGGAADSTTIVTPNTNSFLSTTEGELNNIVNLSNPQSPVIPVGSGTPTNGGWLPGLGIFNWIPGLGIFSQTPMNQTPNNPVPGMLYAQ